MQKQSYFPSPFRKDYTTKPLRNFTPIIIKQQSKPSTVRNVQPTPSPIIQIKTKYQDGLLVKLVNLQNIYSGLFFIKNTGCILYNFVNDKPEGQLYVFYLSGVILQANYQKGVLNGWIIAMLKGKFIICNYYNKGIKDQYQYFYEVQQKLIIVSQYKKGKFIQIKNGQHGQFHSIIKNKELSNKIFQLQQNKFKIHSQFPRQKFEGFDYFGEYSKKNNTPHGYGVLIGQCELFMGNFNTGYLNGIGGIKYQNGDFYYGQFNNGVYDGYGAIHQGHNIIYKFDREQISKAQFIRFLQLQFGSNGKQEWCDMLKDLQMFHQQFKNSYSVSQQNKESQNQEQNEQQSSFKLQSGQQDEQQNESFNSEHVSNKNKNSQENKTSKIPKLSLFQQMKLNQGKKQQNKNNRKIKKQQDILIRQEQKGRQKERQGQKIQNLTQRRYQPKIQTKQISKSYKKQKNQTLKLSPTNNRTQKTTYNRTQKTTYNQRQKKTERRQQPAQTQDFTFDKWHVTAQHNLMRPNQLQPKQKINKNTQLSFKRNERNPKINMGRIMKVGSEFSDTRQNQFLQMIQQ